MTNLRDTVAREQVPASCAKFSHRDINAINELRTHYAKEVTPLNNFKHFNEVRRAQSVLKTSEVHFISPLTLSTSRRYQNGLQTLQILGKFHERILRRNSDFLGKNGRKCIFFTLNVSNTLTFEVNSKKKNTRTLQYLIDIYTLFASREVRIGKNCARGLEQRPRP